MTRTAIGAALLCLGVLFSEPTLAAPRSAPAFRAPALPRPAIRPAPMRPRAVQLHHKKPHHWRRHRFARRQITAVVEWRPFAGPRLIQVDAKPGTETNAPAIAQTERKAGCDLEDVPVPGQTVTIIRC